MSSSSNTPETVVPPLDLSKWRMLPNLLIIIGGIGALIGFFVNRDQFAFSWLLAFMFFLSLGLGGLGFTILHHLFDASWSVPIRRIFENLAVTMRHLLWLWIPIGLLAPRLYDWMKMLDKHMPDHSTVAKYPLFTVPGFYITSIICLLVWWWLPSRLRYWSLKQDETGSVECTRMMRRYAASGIVMFALTLTMAAILWVKALQHEWYSTMYGVYYFAGSMWVTMATTYIITLLLQRQGPLRGFVHEKTFYFMGSILFAFTVFYAYVTFAQYFIIWNANVPEETFFYVLREKGSWWYVGQIMIFGHFFLPFLLLLRIDWKLKLTLMGPMAIWAWLMHATDLDFNIMPNLHHNNFHLDWMDLACAAFIGGVFAKAFFNQLLSHPILPQKDPRFAESQDIYVMPDQFVESATARGIDHKPGGAH
jgi:hypothetical protein